MKLFILFSVFFIVSVYQLTGIEAQLDTTPYELCDNVTMKTCYRIYPEEGLTWIQAFQRCHEEDPTQHLVAIETSLEMSWVIEAIKKSLLRPTGFWTSGSDKYKEGIYVWMNSGKSVSPAYFGAGEPNNDGNCLIMWKGANYKLGDVDCNYTKSIFFICERKSA